MANPETARLDLLLVRLRFARSRSHARRWISEGHIRCNRQRVLRIGEPIGVGDVLTLPVAERVLVIRICALPLRRGPPGEARSCYESLDAG